MSNSDRTRDFFVSLWYVKIHVIKIPHFKQSEIQTNGSQIISILTTHGNVYSVWLDVVWHEKKAANNPKQEQCNAKHVPERM